MNTLELKNISCKSNNKKCINDLSFKLRKGRTLSILSSSYKSLIANIIDNKVKFNGSYKINGVEIVKANDYLVNRFVKVIYNDKIDLDKKVVDFLFDSLNGMDYSLEQIENRVKKIVDYFNLDVLDYKLGQLNDDKYYLVKIIGGYLKECDYIVFDNILCYVNNNDLDNVFAYAKSKKMSIINITVSLKEAMKSDYNIYLYNGNIVMEGTWKSCFSEEKILKRLGYELPFMYDLSLQLSYYKVLDGPCIDSGELINKIWN